MNTRRTIALAAALLVASVANSGHELPVYPSYYPHEIEIRTIAPGEAADVMRAGNLHAFVGTTPACPPNPPNTVGAVESLGSLLVVRLNPDSPLAGDTASACATVGAIVRDLAARTDAGRFTFHAYPVTPWHGDYLNHIDLAEDARQRILAGRASPPAGLKVHAGSVSAKKFVRPEWLAERPLSDATIEEIDVSGLVA